LPSDQYGKRIHTVNTAPPFSTGLREWAVESDDGLMVFAETMFAQ
jgi:hypothetical protein